MLKRFIGIAVVGLVSVVFTPLTMAMTSVCSAAATGPEASTSLHHEATWSLHDNWFHNLFVQMHSQVAGPVSAARSDTIALALGGHVRHQLAQPEPGEYTVRGQLHIGYPLAWGFDDYYTVACEPWRGQVTSEAALADAQRPSDNNDLSDQTVAALAGTRLEAWLAGVCADSDQQALCERVRALTIEEQAALAERMEQIQFPLYRVSGFIAAMDEREIIIRSTQGQYGRFDLGEQVTFTRHTQVLYSAVRADDWVQVQRPASAEREARVLVFRGGAEQLPDYRASPGLAQRVELPSDTIVTLIEPAARAELQQIVSYVRVLASPRDDGRLEVQRIEVLR